MNNPFNGKEVLIVEDEAFLSKILRERLEEEGFKAVHVASTGSEGLEQAQTIVPDLMLLDLILPNMNGFDVLKQVKNGEKTKDIPVLVLSNLGQDRDVEQAMADGALDYIVKSNFSLQTIVNKLRELLDDSTEK